MSPKDPTMRTLKICLGLLPVVLVLDLVWLGFIMKDFYKSELGSIARRNGDALAPNLLAAALVYLLIVVGLVAFVHSRLGPQSTNLQAFLWGIAFGGVVYGVYDLTNLALIANWSVRITLVDIAWGCFLCGTSSVAMRWLSMWLDGHA